HVLAGESQLKDILIPGPFGITIIPAASGVRQMAEMTPAQHAQLVRSFAALQDEYDVLIVDTAAGISDSVITFSRASQYVLVVVTEEPTSLADAYGL
ncbi:MinD/ParA family protein, partial [Acinetobacter baumannii]